MVTVHLVNHTHWDREWYFTTMDALVLSEQLFTEVLNELEKNREANFCLDGQVSIVDEYVEVHPEEKERIRKLVNEGRLFVGPWYTQTDALIPDSESIIRNLVIGIKETKEKYGKPMMVGYLPDTFGFNAQMPTLLQQVGIDNILFWRGINFDKQVRSVYFHWKGLGDKQIFAINFPFGYFTGQITPESKQRLKEFVSKRYDPAVKFESEHGNHNDVLMPSGIDQMNIVKDISESVKKLNEISSYRTVLDTYPNFVNLIRKKKDLPEYQGELRFPTYARVHRTIGSVRHEIKHQNFLLEQKILKRIEPLCVIGNKCGISIGNGLLIKLWKKLLECQAHDSLGGCVSDNVATDIFHRFKEANEIADGIENMVKKKIAEYLRLDSRHVLLFNTTPYEFKGEKTMRVLAGSKNIKINGMEDAVITNSLLYPSRKHIMMMTPKGKEFTDEPEYFEMDIKGYVEIPALGYKILTIEHADEKLKESEKTVSKSYNSISHGNQTIQFANGKINLLSGTKRLSDILQLVDAANDGDTYDYSPLQDDEERTLSFQKAAVETAGSHETLVMYGADLIMADLENRVSNQPEYGSLTYVLKMSFDDQGVIRCHLTVENQVKSHRLRLRFDPKINTDKALAQIQAGYMETSNQPIDENWKDEFDEKPVNLYNFDKTVTIRDAGSHFTFWAYGQKEYEYTNNSLFITLMATTSQLGKPNLAWRPGRASGDTTNQGHIMMPTPLAEELGENNFDFAFNYDETPFNVEDNNRMTRDLLNPSVSYQMQNLNMFINRLDNKIWETEDNPHIPSALSIIQVNQDIDVAAVYPAYSDEGSFIIRIQNLTDQKKKIPDYLLNRGTVVNALEKAVEDKYVGPFDFLSVKMAY